MPRELHRWAGLCGLALLLGAACATPDSPPAPARQPPAVQPFGTMEDGSPVDLYTLTNANGMEVRITNYGATVVSIRTPDRHGTLGDVVLGFDTLDDYVARNTAFLGAVVGRYGNRIANGRLTLDGTEYQLPLNNGPHHLHGGPRGFDKMVWAGKAIDSADGRPSSWST
jgi:aldose 1-epimerase